MTIERTYRRLNRALRLAHSAEAQDVLSAAREILATRIRHGDVLNSPGAVRDYLQLVLHSREYEVFVVVLLDAQNRVLASEEMFRGTLTQTSVYPREVVKTALRHNAAAVIFAHNHPSGVTEPSHADQLLTQSLKQALALVDIKVLDHFIIAGGSSLSMAERGML
jgi:DNA repair protein RadC